MVIAAFLGLSLLLRWGFASALLGLEGLGGGTDLDIWAADSGRLMVAASSDILVSWMLDCGVGCGLVLISSSFGPAIEVSGMPAFLGGGGIGSGRP